MGQPTHILGVGTVVPQGANEVSKVQIPIWDHWIWQARINCQALVPSPVPLDPNKSKIQNQVQSGLGWHQNHMGVSLVLFMTPACW